VGINRRNFVKTAALSLAAAPAGSSTAEPAAGASSAASSEPDSPRPTSPVPTSEKIFNAIQVGPYTLLDEGIERALDLMQSTAAINALFVYSHTYNGDFRKAVPILADDHGVPPHDNRNRHLPFVWIKHHEESFKNTTLRNQVVDNSFDYADRDIFAELLAAARNRGMKLYARILEGTNLAHAIANFSKVVTVDHAGKPSTVACWNHPEYIGFWTDTVADMFRHYELDGLQWGAERAGPLMNTVLPWNNAPAACFCEHCQARAKSHGIDSQRARQGFQELYEYVQALMAGKAKPVDGVFVGFLRVLLRYPEILAWEYQYRLSREEMLRSIHDAVKAVKATAEVGWHVDHQPSTWDIVYRAEMSYAEMAPYSDFLKIILYHDVAGPRLRNWYLERLRRTVFSEVPLDESLNLYYDLFGYDKGAEPKVEQLAARGLSPDYVFRETRRSVASAAGKTKVYSGIGFDVPGSPRKADPENVYQAVHRAFDAGAAGIVVSREYEEMRVPNLNAVGRAIRELANRSG
jgi:hypothetical protein